MRAGAWREGHPTSVGEMLVMDIGGILFSSSHDFCPAQNSAKPPLITLFDGLVVVQRGRRPLAALFIHHFPGKHNVQTCDNRLVHPGWPCAPLCVGT